ncbi:c-type cytochrome [Actibacterium pelagium]|uniref:Cytochrome c-554 n=1 Tax=Actibacterium pelagium TaxID=2029103 RepID=A0A917ACM8_9RHOB|nr:cytochrome c [Actibacterium pelagium]GGE42978.1 cytochrome c-554 [Actibacterium pelagium]
MKFRKVAVIAAGALLATTTVFAESHGAKSPYDSQIKARKGMMNLYAVNLGVLGGMAREKIAYDAEAAQVAADNLVALTSVNVNSLWPQGSDSASTEGTRALPEIWSNFPDVGAKSGALKDAAAAMQGLAGADLASLQSGMGALGGACGACHKAYRQEQ